jgi:hypothetical protein
MSWYSHFDILLIIKIIVFYLQEGNSTTAEREAARPATVTMGHKHARTQSTYVARRFVQILHIPTHPSADWFEITCPRQQWK